MHRFHTLVITSLHRDRTFLCSLSVLTIILLSFIDFFEQVSEVIINNLNSSSALSKFIGTRFDLMILYFLACFGHDITINSKQYCVFFSSILVLDMSFL